MRRVRRVLRVLRKHGYMPDKQAKAVDTVIEQAESLSEEWVAVQPSTEDRWTRTFGSGSLTG